MWKRFIKLPKASVSCMYPPTEAKREQAGALLGPIPSFARLTWPRRRPYIAGLRGRLGHEKSNEARPHTLDCRSTWHMRIHMGACTVPATAFFCIGDTRLGEQVKGFRLCVHTHSRLHESRGPALLSYCLGVQGLLFIGFIELRVY